MMRTSFAQTRSSRSGGRMGSASPLVPMVGLTFDIILLLLELRVQRLLEFVEQVYDGWDRCQLSLVTADDLALAIRTGARRGLRLCLPMFLVFTTLLIYAY